MSEEDGVVVSVPTGGYVIETHDVDGAVAQVRINLKGEVDLNERRAKNVWTDCAILGIMDWGLLNKAFDLAGDDEAFLESYNNAVFETEQFGVHDFGLVQNARLYNISSGDGDGVWAAFDLINQDRVVGLRVDFRSRVE